MLTIQQWCALMFVRKTLISTPIIILLLEEFVSFTAQKTTIDILLQGNAYNFVLAPIISEILSLCPVFKCAQIISMGIPIRSFVSVIVV